MFVVPLDFRHFQKTINQLVVATFARISRGRFILANVPALEPAGAVHRRQPTHHVTQKPKSPADQVRPRFAPLAGSTFQTGEHFTNQLAVSPLIVLNVLNRSFLLRVADRLPVPPIGMRRRQLT